MLLIVVLRFVRGFVHLEDNPLLLVGEVAVAQDVGVRVVINLHCKLILEVVLDLLRLREGCVRKFDPDFNSANVLIFLCAFVKEAHSAKPVGVGKHSRHHPENHFLPERLKEVQVFARKVNLKFTALGVDYVFPHGLDVVLEKTD